MPWCEECSKFWNPTSMAPDGSCPNCGQGIVTTAEEPPPPKAPWHFKLLVAAVVGYLGWRLVQVVGWIL